MQAIVDLRGTFLPPELRQGGYLGRVGRGTLLSARAISPSHCLILATGGAACFEWGSQTPLWEFECPASAAAFDPASGRIALAQEHLTLFDAAHPDQPLQLPGHDGET
ncbi:MAG: hypothetical protein KC910_22885, partial [Candidatus Eremiobacteraeota bacterium]|nr:hypothetical protein [Candidatus Eremiobacteraeota bacterium]